MVVQISSWQEMSLFSDLLASNVQSKNMLRKKKLNEQVSTSQGSLNPILLLELS